jgi:hypothetical protein|tara:strand:- start:8 stop:181 length:174 start_codon:yes stop_codon:yes gene_type:complete
MAPSRWFEVRFDTGASARIMAEDEEEARKKAVNLKQGNVASLKTIGEVPKPKFSDTP